MRHLFISYSHKDQRYKDKLVTVLDKFEINYWSDSKIRIGDTWRDTIDDALENSFAIALILTPNSLQSMYVTYEWAWALGRGKLVFPFLFEDIKPQERNARLGEIQEINCINGIPSNHIELLKKYKTPSTIDIYQQYEISKLFLPIPYFLKLLSWLYDYSQGGEIYPISSCYTHTASSLLLTILNLRENLIPQFLVNVAPSFPTNLRKEFEEIVHVFELIITAVKNVQSPDFEIKTFEQNWQNSLEPLLLKFAGYPHSGLTAFEAELKAIPQDASMVWDETVRVRFVFMRYKLNYAGLSREAIDMINNSFDLLYNLTAPEMLQKIIDDLGSE